MWDGEDDWPEEEESWADESFTVACPECGYEMHEEAEMCPSCGCFPDEALRDHPLMGKPGWFVILGILGVLATLTALLRLF